MIVSMGILWYIYVKPPIDKQIFGVKFKLTEIMRTKKLNVRLNWVSMKPEKSIFSERRILIFVNSDLICFFCFLLTHGIRSDAQNGYSDYRRIATSLK